MSQSSSAETSARVVVLENENNTNKIKLVEQNFNNQLNLLKLEFETKLSEVENKQKQYPQNFHSRNKTSQDLKDLTFKHDALNTRMRKMEKALEENIKQKDNKDSQSDRRRQSLVEDKESNIFRIPFTPLPNPKANLLYQTQSNLHKSLSEELPKFHPLI